MNNLPLKNITKFNANPLTFCLATSLHACVCLIGSINDGWEETQTDTDTGPS